MPQQPLPPRWIDPQLATPTGQPAGQAMFGMNNPTSVVSQMGDIGQSLMSTLGIEPFGPTNPNSYSSIPQDIGMARPKALARPKFQPAFAGSNPETPAFALTKGGRVKLGFDILQAGKEMGTSLYTGNADQVITKELLQNAVDATRKTPGAKINVLFHKSKPIEPGATVMTAPKIQVVDNGPGMTQGELESVFTNLHSSGKASDASASGGKGVAKASFLLNVAKNETESTVPIARAIEEREANFKRITNPKSLLSPEEAQLASDPNEIKLLSSHLSDLKRWQSTGAKTVTYRMESTPEELMTTGAPPIVARPNTTTATGVDVTAHMHDKADQELYWGREFLSSAVKKSKGMPDVYGSTDLYGNGNPFQFLKHENGLLSSFGETTPSGVVDFPNNEIIDTPEAAIHAHWSNLKEEPSAPNSANVLNNGFFQFQTSVAPGWAELPHLPEHLTFDVQSKIREGEPNYPFTTNREQLNSLTLKAMQDWYTKNIHNKAFELSKNATQRQYDSLKPAVGKYVFFDSGGKLAPGEATQFTQNPQARKLYNVLGNMVEDSIHRLHGQEGLDKIDKIGFILSDKVHGVYIPSPKEGQAAILINPFSFLTTRGAPDQAAAGLAHTILHEVIHHGAHAHNEKFTVALADAYARMGVTAYSDWSKKILNAIQSPNAAGEIHPQLHSLLDLYSESRGRPISIPDVISGKGTSLAGPEAGRVRANQSSLNVRSGPATPPLPPPIK